MHPLVRFARIPAANTFSTGEIHRHVIAALGCAAEQYSLASLRYDLSKLRAKGLVEKLPRRRRYRLHAAGYSVCPIFPKLFDRVYAPLTAGVLHPVSGDAALPGHKRSPLDRLYRRLADDLDHLLCALGLAFSSPVNENKILVGAPITA
jgi:DNA-binding transcriptional ArsR family regulator